MNKNQLLDKIKSCDPSNWWCATWPVGMSIHEYYETLSDLLAERYIDKPFRYILATNKALSILAIGGTYTPYSISHKKKAFKEAIGTIRISIGKRRAQIPAVFIDIDGVDGDYLVTCAGKYKDNHNVTDCIYLYTYGTVYASAYDFENTKEEDTQE